jgi:hypothetical protein
MRLEYCGPPKHFWYQILSDLLPGCLLDLVLRSQVGQRTCEYFEIVEESSCFWVNARAILESEGEKHSAQKSEEEEDEEEEKEKEEEEEKDEEEEEEEE